MNNTKNWLTNLGKFKYKILISLFLLIIAGFVDYAAGEYTTRIGSVTSPDLILSLIPPIDLSIIFTYGWISIIFFLFLYTFFMKIKVFHRVVYHFSLLSILRSIFIMFTHLRTPLNAIPVTFPWPFEILRFHNDLFFSGHTSFPLVGFYIFKGKIRWVFLAFSVIMGFTVLAMHQHYSIDVFSAYFIAYGSFKIGEYLLDKLNKISIHLK